MGRLQGSILLAWAALAVPCPEIRPMTAPGGTLDRYAPEQQADTGTCYLYALTQALDAYRGSREPSSALEAALLEGATQYQDLQAGGSSCGALQLIRRRGTCSQERIDRFLGRIRRDGKVEDALQGLRRAYRQVVRARASSGPAGARAVEESMARLRTELVLLSPEAGSRAGLLPELVEQSFVKAHDGSRRPNEFLFLYLLVRTACDRREPVPRGLRCVTECVDDGYPECAALRKKYLDDPAGRRRYFRQRLNALLTRSRNPQPVGISYCSEVLYQGPAWQGLDDHGSPVSDARCGLHTSLVTGQRFNAARGRCQVLVRNAYGQDCEGFWDARRRTGRREDRWDCDPATGSVWVDRDALIRNADELWHLTRDPARAPAP